MWPQPKRFKTHFTVKVLDSCIVLPRARVLKSLGLGLMTLVHLVTAQAVPKDLNSYTLQKGGYVDVQDGAYVEGSTAQGGLQPDYLIDLNSSPIKEVLLKAKAIKSLKLAFWDTISKIIPLVESEYFKYHDYKNPYYLRLIKRYRDLKKDIPLSEYGKVGAGVCREYALMLHFALKAAGIPNRHVYAKIFVASRTERYELTEDHAFTVVKYQGEDWAVDAYNWRFNGYRMKDLLSKAGITQNSPAAPIAFVAPGTRKILKINDFPRVYQPKPKANPCQRLFGG